MTKKKNIQDVLKKVRQVEIKAKRLSDHIFAGEYHTTFKGRGMSFAEVREYNYGDEVRNIDWNVTARYGSTYVKEFEEERELNIFLLVDISQSEIFGSDRQSKREMITDIVAMLSFSALKNNDKVGLILFTDKVEHFIPPRNGRKHMLHIIRDVLAYETADSPVSDPNSALEYVQRIQKRKTICFILSDFITEDISRNVAIMSRKHDLIGVHVWDRFDRVLPDLGLVQVQDPETTSTRWIDTHDKSTQRHYTEAFDKVFDFTKNLFARYGLDLIQVRTDMDYVPQFQSFFKNRMRHR